MSHAYILHVTLDTKMHNHPRREFLMKTAMIAAAAPFAGASALGQTTNKKLGVALCGLGSLATHQIAPALQKTKHCRLAGVVTGDLQKGKRWQKQYGLPDGSVYSYDTMAKWVHKVETGALFYFFHDSLPTQIAPMSNVVQR